MTSLQPYNQYQITNKWILDYAQFKTKNNIESKDFSPKESLIVYEDIDEFQYPSLSELRQQFKDTGLYTEVQLDRIIEVYGRLPKYRTQRSSAARGRKRS